MKELWTLKFLPPNPVGLKTLFLPVAPSKPLNPKELIETLSRLQKFFKEVELITRNSEGKDQLQQIEELTRIIKEIDKWLAKNILFQ